MLTWYPVIVSSSGSSQVSATSVAPAVAESAVGAAGTAIGLAFTVATRPLPVPFTARTANVYRVPLVRPVTVYPVGGALGSVTAMSVQTV